VIGAAAVVTVLSVLAPAPQATLTQGYSGMCIVMEGPHASQYRRELAFNGGSTSLPVRVREAATRLFPGSDVKVLFRTPQRTADVRTFESEILQVGSGGRRRFFTVTVARDGTVLNVKPAATNEVSERTDHVRSMAAYIYFNQLMADDSTLHRASCNELLQIQAASAPGLFPAFKRALEAAPAPDRVLRGRVQAAYRRALAGVPALDEARRPIMRETVRRLGSSPPITVVYRDRDTSTGEEWDVIRLGTPSAHTYALFFVDSRNPGSIGPTVLCITGDLRCGALYGWP
jgi:hypothetical protein